MDVNVKILTKPCIFLTSYLLFLFLFCEPLSALVLKSEDVFKPHSLVTKERRKTIATTDSGQISVAYVDDGYRGPYHLQFITLEPNSLFLPVMLQADMVFYVHTGKGELGWTDEEAKEMRRLDLQRGDVYRLELGSVFYFQSDADPMREKLRIHALFTNKITENSPDGSIKAYLTMRDLVLGFDKRVLQMAFQAHEEVIQRIIEAKKPPLIVHATVKNESHGVEKKAGMMEALLGGSNKKKSKAKAFNILHRKPDFKNSNGWSLAVNYKEFSALRGSDIGLFLVNLTKGSMMGPHWNPRATEIAIVTHGQGMIAVVCPSDAPQCKNVRFRVKEGDLFVVPRFHPMAQISFNNDSFVFMGFTTLARNNWPQFLAGKRSVFQTIDREILALSFNVPNITIQKFLSNQGDAVILECVSCAEVEEKKMEEEIEKEKQKEEERRRREDEEEARKREKEEEEERKREEEEEARKREKEEEEERKREKEDEEERKREEEEDARKRDKEKEKERKREKEEERKREEEEARRQEEEEARRRREEKWWGEGGGGGDEKERRTWKKMWQM